jgi:predicted transcriptional regulator
MFGGKKNLSNLEHLVMDVLWKRGPSTAEEVRVALEKRHFMKESTARTILKRLEDKGYARHRVEGQRCGQGGSTCYRQTLRRIGGGVARRYGG